MKNVFFLLLFCFHLRRVDIATSSRRVSNRFKYFENIVLNLKQFSHY